MKGKSGAQKVTVFMAVVDEIAKRDETVATELKSDYIRLASDAVLQAGDRFFEDMFRLIVTYPDTGHMTCYLQREAEQRPKWARQFLNNAPLIFQSVRM